MATAKTIKLAAVGDLHFGRNSQGSLKPHLEKVAEMADLLVLCGDLTDYGLPEEAQLFAQELSAVGKMPIIAVLGNHDFEAGKQDEVRQILANAGLHILDGDTCEVLGIGFAGTKGFGGGFGRHCLAPWGESTVKGFVQEAIAETLKLESALARLRTERRFAVLHYAPIADTVEGEPLEIYPFLGCGRLEEPLNRYPIDAVFHGHAHHGRLKGKTQAGVAVHNVAYSLLQNSFPDRPPFLMVDVPVAPHQPETEVKGAGHR